MAPCSARPGGTLIAAGIAVSTFGFLNLVILVSPRVYQAMAADGLFFPRLARLHPRYRTPSAAILFQGVWAVILTLTGTLRRTAGLRGLRRLDLLWRPPPRRSSSSGPGSGAVWSPVRFRMPGYPAGARCLHAGGALRGGGLDGFQPR